MSGCLSQCAICIVKALGFMLMDMQTQFLSLSYAGFFVWSNSNASSSLFTSLPHPSPNQQPEGRQARGCGKCVRACVFVLERGGDTVRMSD